MEFLQHADPLLRAMWYIALSTLLIFLIQTGFTFLGGDASDTFENDLDGGFDTDQPFQLFSFRNLIHFLLGMSWTGIGFYQLIPNQILLTALSVLVGAALVGLFFVIMRQIRKLNQNNAMRIENAIGKTAQVYLTIPAAQQGQGKVHITIQNTLHELSAVTRQGQPIATGQTVMVMEILNDNILVVSSMY